MYLCIYVYCAIMQQKNFPPDKMFRTTSTAIGF